MAIDRLDVFEGIDENGDPILRPATDEEHAALIAAVNATAPR